MLKLTNFEDLPAGSKLLYTVSHSTPGRDGTTLSASLSLYIRMDKTWCDMKIEGCEGSTPKESLDRMAAWLRRLADGIDERREISLPV